MRMASNNICNQDIEIEFKESGKNMPLSVEETTDQLRMKVPAEEVLRPSKAKSWRFSKR